MERFLIDRDAPPVAAWQTESNDGYPALRVNMGNASRNGAVREVLDESIRLELRPYKGGHASLNTLLVFRGLVSALADFRITASEGREAGRGSELAMRVTVRTRSEEVFRFPEEVESPERLYEGATHKVSINAYERNPAARKRCIEHYGVNCAVCGFNFGLRYGTAGEGLIHVHHLQQLSKVGAEYEVDPIKDLRPVCANCHAVIHRRSGQPYSLEEVMSFVGGQDAK